MILLTRNKWKTANEFSAENKNELLEDILSKRGIKGFKDYREYLDPPLSVHHDPFLFQDMEKACSLISGTIRENKKILIFGDYDVDGITAAASLYLYLLSSGAHVQYIIPDRITEGYGLGDAGVRKILDSGADLLITVDCGIASLDETKILKDEGIRVIITDHHECKDKLPEADAVINPKNPGDSYPFSGLSGSGVVLKLIQALCTGKDFISSADEWKNYVDLASLGTFGDVVQLSDENRTIAYHGIKSLNNGNRAGIQTLLSLVQTKIKEIDPVTIGYTIVPHLNAAGRMGDGARAVKLLAEDNVEKCTEIANELIKENNRRKETEADIFEQVKGDLLSVYNPMAFNTLVAYNKQWHQGVVGIVASRLSDYFRRSVIVFAWDGENYKGSGRSSENESILEAIEYAKEYTVSFGGHKKAAGITVKENMIDSFIKSISEFPGSGEAENSYENTIEIDYKVNFESITMKNALDIEKLEPFGEGNKKPLFLCENMYVLNTVGLSDGKHTKMILSPEFMSTDYLNRNTEGVIEAIAFGFSEKECNISSGDIIDVVFHLQVNRWNNKEKIQIVVKDFKKSPDNVDLKIDELEFIYKNNPEGAFEFIKGNKDIKIYSLPEKSDFKYIYRYLSSNFSGETVVFDMGIMSQKIESYLNKKISSFKLARIFDIFEETMLISLQNITDTLKVMVVKENPKKVSLKDSYTYRRIMQEVDVL